MGSDWSEWRKHDGSGCPVPGRFVHVKYHTGSERMGIALSGQNGNKQGSWDWNEVPGAARIVEFRVKIPRALKMLRDIAQGIKQPEDA